MKGKQIKTVEELAEAVKARRSITGPMFGDKPIPAIVLLNMQGRTILNLIKHGVYLYEKPPKRPTWPVKAKNLNEVKP